MEEKKKKKFGIVRWILLGILVLLIAVFATVAIVLARVFDHQPMAVNRQPLNMMDSLTAGRVIMRDVPRSLQNTVKGRKKELLLREREVNAILKFLFIQMKNNRGKQGPFDPARTEVILKNGIFTAKSVLHFPKMALFGNYINVVVQFRLAYADGKEQLSILSAKAGNWNISEDDILRSIEEGKKQYLKNSKVERILRRTLRSAGSDVRGYSIVYEPYEAVEGIDREYYGGKGTFRKMMDQQQ